MAKYILVRLSIISLLFLSSFSCGVKDEVNPDLEVFDIEEAGAGPNCKFDTAKLAKILEEDIHGEIKCLEANLDNFVKFVRRENPNYISLSELKSFIQRFFPENADKVHKLLGFVFKLNTLLLKDPHESISLANLPLLFELFQIVNIEGQKLSKELKEFNKNTYWENRNTMFAAASALGTKGLDVTKRRKDNETSTLDIPDFLEKIKDLLELTDEQFNIDLIKDYLFAKKLILGGDKNILTSSQFTGLLEKAPSLLITGLDAISISTKEFKTKETEWFFYFDLVNDLRSFFFIQPDSDVIVEQDNLLRIAEKLLDNKYDIVKQMGSSIKKVKPKLIGGDKQFYSYKDAKALIGLAQDFFGAQYFNDITYSHFKRVLDSPLPIINLRNPNLPEYQLFSKSQIKYLWNEFRFVTEHYRYFSDSAGFINFHNTYKRTRKGYSQNTTLRWAFKKLIHAYGSFRGERRKEVSIDEMRVLLYDIKGILKEPNLNFWPKDPERFISEAVNGSDLFQWQGDGNTFTDVEEATEYFTTILASTKVEKDIHQRMQGHCPLVGPDSNSFEISCYRDYWYQVFFNELKLEVYFPKLKAYIDKVGTEVAHTYLVNLEVYAREIPDEQLPMTKIDIKRLVIAFSNLETVMERYDFNKDGKLDKRELDQAFHRFKELIIKVGGLKPSTEFFAPSIFLYLIKKMKIPSTIQLALFHFLGKKKKITSTRFQIAAILSFFIESN